MVSAPHLSLPGDVGQVLAHLAARREARDVDQAGGAVREQARQFVVALAVDGAMARGSLHENQPVAVREVDDEVGQLAVFVERDAESETARAPTDA